MKKSSLIFIIVILVIAVGGGYFFLTQRAREKANEPTEVVIGFNADQSVSSIAGFGVLAKWGAEIAVDEINAQGGILGKNVRLVALDDKSDPDISRQNMEQLISQDKVLAVIGPANSNCAFNWIDLAQDNETIVMVPLASASEITTTYSERPRNYIFGIRALDKDQIRLSIAWAIRKTNNGKIAIIYDSTPYGLQGLKDTNEVLGRWGKTPVYTKSFDRGISVGNFIQIIEDAETAKADAIILYSYPDSNADFLKALNQVGNYDPIVIGTAANIGGLAQLAGALASKVIFPAPLAADYNEDSKALNQKVIDKYGKEPFLLSTAASGYDSVYLIRDAIEKAGVVNGKAVRDAMEKLESYDAIMRVFKNPYSKQNHELLEPKDSFLSRWVGAKIVTLDEDVSNLEIR